MAVVGRTLHERSVWLPRLGRAGKLLLQLMAGVLALLALAVVMQQGLAAGQRVLHDVQYGYPRSVSLVGYVGHGDERHFPTFIQAMNLNGQVGVMVIPGGDMQQMQLLDGPYVVGRSGRYAVPHPALEDVNNDGHVDLLVTIREETVVYMNDTGQFRTMTMEERATLQEQWDTH